jgi:hypothetical protein
MPLRKKSSENELQVLVRNERDRIRKRYQYLDRCREILREQERANQKRCLHDGETTYYGDPAGGSDSWTECCICLGEIPKNRKN